MKEMNALRDVILGACVGDAVGAQLEFIKKRPIPQELVMNAARMCGGGYLNLSPGQITDDGELTISLALALQRNVDPMIMYKKWLQSEPVDIGIATQHAISSGIPHPTTEANGALMRCSPIPAFYYRDKTFEEISQLARQDAQRTHASAVCQEVNAVYSVALAHLLLHKDPRGAIAEARRHAHGDSRAIVLRWIDEATVKSCSTGIILQGETKDNIGWVRWGLQYAFYHLYWSHSYEKAIIDVVTCGGDTDTNAAITGALLAAYWGSDNIPKVWIQAVCSCKVRPKWLRPIYWHRH